MLSIDDILAGRTAPSKPAPAQARPVAAAGRAQAGPPPGAARGQPQMMPAGRATATPASPTLGRAQPMSGPAGRAVTASPPQQRPGATPGVATPTGRGAPASAAALTPQQQQLLLQQRMAAQQQQMAGRGAPVAAGPGGLTPQQQAALMAQRQASAQAAMTPEQAAAIKLQQMRAAAAQLQQQQAAQQQQLATQQQQQRATSIPSPQAAANAMARMQQAQQPATTAPAPQRAVMARSTTGGATSSAPKTAPLSPTIARQPAMPPPAPEPTINPMDELGLNLDDVWSTLAVPPPASATPVPSAGSAKPASAAGTTSSQLMKPASCDICRAQNVALQEIKGKKLCPNCFAKFDAAAKLKGPSSSAPTPPPSATAMGGLNLDLGSALDNISVGPSSPRPITSTVDAPKANSSVSFLSSAADSFKMSLLGGEDEDGGQAKASAASKPAPEPARGPASWLDKGNSNKGNTFNSRPMTALKQAEIERKQREEEEKRADELRRIEQERRQIEEERRKLEEERRKWQEEENYARKRAELDARTREEEIARLRGEALLESSYAPPSFDDDQYAMNPDFDADLNALVDFAAPEEDPIIICTFCKQPFPSSIMLTLKEKPFCPKDHAMLMARMAERQKS